MKPKILALPLLALLSIAYSADTREKERERE